jgi:hypothetical protein
MPSKSKIKKSQRWATCKMEQQLHTLSYIATERRTAAQARPLIIAGKACTRPAKGTCNMAKKLGSKNAQQK